MLLVVKDAWVAHNLLRLRPEPCMSRERLESWLPMLYAEEGVLELTLPGSLLKALNENGLVTGVIVGLSHICHRRVCLAIPSLGDAQLQLILPWGRHCNKAQNTQYMWRVRMAIAQTMGGGWASVRNVAESLRWALLLQHCAEELGDEASMRKCRVFIGWAHLWNGNREASHEVFLIEKRTAQEVGDEINANRCAAAEAHMEGNPLFQEDKGRVDLPDVAAYWAESFEEHLQAH